MPATIPVGTLLYHGSFSSPLPTKPDWLAFDFDHAYMFAIFKDSWVHTFMATRNLHVMYFDGSSAAKMINGTLDTQDLMVWGEVHADWGNIFRDRERLDVLCDWGKGYGVDGFVRMEMHLCVPI